MAYCQYCGRKTDEDALFCHWCGEGLVEEDTGWQDAQVREAVDEADRRANGHTILAIVLVTTGLAAGGVLCVSSGPIGLFGIALVCLGVALAAAARRHERKASNLRKLLRP